MKITCLSFLFLIPALLSGCVSSQQYRTNYAIDENPSPTNSTYVIEKTKNYTLGYVEFDDQGWLWDRRQVDAVTKEFSSEMKTQGLLIVTFVHGWKHNADTRDDNVEMVRNALDRIARIETYLSRREGHPPRRIAGVYVGWRGLSETVEPFKEMSFWARKNTAEIVGHGAVVELLATLEDLKNHDNHEHGDGIAANERPNSKLIIVGHSFGADIVYSATAQILAERMAENSSTNGAPRSPKSLGDMVILINPAFEAARFETLQSLATNCAASGEFTSHNCTLAVFTSKGDTATKFWFPFGRHFSTQMETYRDVNQAEADVTAVGHYAPFITYDLRLLETNAETNAVRSLKMQETDELSVRASVEKIISLKEQRKQAKAPKSVAKPLIYPFICCELVARTNCIPASPIFVVSVDPNIIRDQDAINSQKFIFFLGEFLFSFSSDTRDMSPKLAGH